MPFRPQPVNTLDRIKNIRNDNEIVTCIVDEFGGIPTQRCVFLAGSTDGIPKVKLASISDGATLPVVGITVQGAEDGKTIDIIRSGFMSIDTGPMIKTVFTNDVLYLGEDGTLVPEPSTDITGNYQIGRVVNISGNEALVMIELISFALSSSVDGVIRSIIENTDPKGAAAFTAKNDLGHYSSFGMTGSDVDFPNTPNLTAIVNSGEGPITNLVLGDFGFFWRTNTGTGLSTKMELTSDGLLQGVGSIKFDGDVTEDGGIWTNMTTDELQIQINGVAYNIPNASYEAVKLRKDAPQLITANTPTDLTWEIEDIDNQNIHSTIPERITFTRDARVFVAFNVDWESKKNRIYEASVRKNDTEVFVAQKNNSPEDGTMVQNAADWIPMSAGDYLTVNVDHDAIAGAFVDDDRSSFSVLAIYHS